MDENAIINNNRNIADFMGYIHSDSTEIDNWEMRSLVYHSSWSALMPVIEKISRIPLMDGGIPCTEAVDTCYPITFNMPDGEGSVMFRFKGSFLNKAPTLIEAAYNAVVEFLHYKTEP